ncbi:FAD-dependent oxidoreductase [Bacteroides finegoldii]|jgi:coA-disulfide reductase|uniref:Pyridine nucleotide-disulfide oxidoreductase n=1 Tax=Bacteroides finegoldii TaxID=338188 RepID=A0A7J4YNZ2_9BACE|nr:FAD-dependent oxidoreductase [Bacteroides finegoldii]EEX44043.1 pyridine nucleotide-disulfide oxidoreductase [Bacteroides finegoldii DSM 17565]KAA5216484.1 pyridine nucleotide-disulfide oxidoreductase [Bacteroides finegoldii]KAA5220824.1 pyridine nucleotide-disulfide oxidoreductase [Bacteroides finegoldii]KAA5225602.1 pyridine nucleotide-disulfide oxidoreductase [Bacteroides finegoldii]KAA5230119.1 pyridine nucleotide-disulfide oxidoreductase [Bacteroides finegoldii]
MKIIIIGGVAGGATTAARIRRVDETAEIILLEKGKHISYANCGLPYYIGGVIEEREKLFVQTPEAFSTRFRVDVRTENEVIFIDRKKKTVTVRQSSEDTYEESYDKLLISTGASPVRPPLPGIDLPGIFTLRNVTDTDRIKEYINSHSPRKAVVVGAGFIGLEMAENLHAQGAKVSIVEMGNQVMAPIDFSMASLVHQHLMDKGVNLYLEQAVASFEREGKGLKVTFKNGQSISADIVILSIGVRPETSLARAAELTIGPAGGIAVNDYLQTSDEAIYAIGDAIEYRHPITGKPWLNYLAGPANRQGRIVADNILGAKIPYEGSIGTSIAKVFDMTVASTGLPGKRLRLEGIDYMSSTIHPASHAGYYPDAMPMSIKITFDKQTGRLYGGQIVGYDGVDKRIDELALVIKHQGTVYDLMKVEQAYAPPFSSAKDPVAIAGYVAEDMITGKTNPVYWRELRDIEMENKFLLDVRTQDEFALGSLPGAVNIPLDELRDRMSELPKDRMIYTFCAVGLRGYLAYRILTQHGFDKVRNLSGGLKTYRAATAPIVIHQENEDQTDESPSPQEKTLSSEPSAAPAIPVAAAKTIRVDACGLQCPGPILKMKKTMDGLASGERVEITATDPGFPRDAAAWCSSTGNQLISKEASGGKSVVIIEKGEPKACNIVTSCEDKGKTFIMFSDDLDKALATFVLANGAAATGQKVTIFFTFWGLNVIKKLHKPETEKDIFGKMFGMMLPSSSKKLKLSKMSMGGIGGKMMRYIMNKKGIDSLESLRQQALENGVEFIACQMSMDVMGVKQEELLDEVTIGGVATYMERADNANVNLFI